MVTDFNAASLNGIDPQQRDDAELALSTADKIARWYQQLAILATARTDPDEISKKLPPPDLTPEEDALSTAVWGMVSMPGQGQETPQIRATFKLFLAKMMHFYQNNPDNLAALRVLENRPRAEAYLGMLQGYHHTLAESYDAVDKFYDDAHREFIAWAQQRIQQMPAPPSPGMP